MREQFWGRIHGVINDLAWRFARPDGPEWGIAGRIDHTRLLWRLNQWAADHYVPGIIARSVGGSND